MSKIKQLLRYLKEGKLSNRKIASVIGLNKETVNNYARKAREDSKSLDELMAMDDPELEHRFKGGSPAYPEDERFKEFQKWLPRLVEEMSNSKKTHVTLKLLWNEYREEVKNPYSLTQFRFHYRQDVKAKKQATKTVLKDLYVPGMTVYVDFAGDKMSYVDMETGEIVEVEVFVANFPYSDYGFAIAVESQGAEDVAYSMTQLFKSIGGVPKIIVPDNMKSAVDRSDRHAPKLNALFEDMANFYGCFVQPARVCHPRDKGGVENNVRLTYQRAYAPLRHKVFHSLAEINKALSEQMRAHNQKRMQHYDHTREECFLANEAPRLRPLPVNDYEVKYTHHLKVGDNCLVYLSKHKAYYSAPCGYVFQYLTVVVTRSLVKMYYEGKCVATHPRNDKKIWNIIDEHLPRKSQEWRHRDKEWFIRKGHDTRWVVGEYIKGVFDHCGTHEQCMYKTCDAILHLAYNTEPRILTEAISMAENLGKYSFRILDNLVRNLKAAVPASLSAENMSPPSDHAGIRGAAAFK